MRIVLGLVAMGGLLLLEALRSRRARPIPQPLPETVVVHLMFDTRRVEEGLTALKAGLEQLADAFRNAGPTVAQVLRNMSVLANRDGVPASWWEDEVGEPDVVLLDHSKCWRCEFAPVPREDDLGLCAPCAAHLQSL